MIISCEQCGAKVEAKTSRRRFCSEVCKYQARVSRSSVTCSICGEPMYTGRTTTKEEPAHNVCRRSVVGGHGATGYRKGCRCDECRAAATERMRKYAARVKARDGVSPSVQYKRKRRGYSEELLSCGLCGDQLARVPANGERGYHKDCRQKVPTWLAKGLPGPRQRQARKRLEKAATGRPSTGRVFTQGACNWCGEQFMSSGGSFFCSYNCRKAHRHHTSGGVSFTISPVTRREIYERDGWVCQLCERPVDPELRNPDLWSASLDHVVPQSAVIIPDHSAENLRLSHLLCNSYRRETEISVEEIRALTEERWELVAAI